MLFTALAPIQPLMDDPQTVEVMVNPDNQVWVEYLGHPQELTDIKINTEQVERVIRHVASLMGDTITPENPRLSGTLPKWTARIQAAIPPLVTSPSFCIRLPPKTIFTLSDYVEQAILSQRHADTLRQAVLDKKNILLGGGTGSGKTTLANALLDVMATTDDRILIVEDNQELQCNAKNKVHFYTGTYCPLHTLLIDILRWAPDRIIIGEVRDKSALELLKSWNTGHPGGIATIHADTAAKMISRLCQLIEENNMVAPKEFIAETIDLCVHIVKDSNVSGGRRVSGISALCGYKNNNWVFNPVD